MSRWKFGWFYVSGWFGVWFILWWVWWMWFEVFLNLGLDLGFSLFGWLWLGFVVVIGKVDWFVRLLLFKRCLFKSWLLFRMWWLIYCRFYRMFGFNVVVNIIFGFLWGLWWLFLLVVLLFLVLFGVCCDWSCCFDYWVLRCNCVFEVGCYMVGFRDLNFWFLFFIGELWCRLMGYNLVYLWKDIIVVNSSYL